LASATAGGNASNGVLLQVWDCNDSDNQQWYYDIKAGTINYKPDSGKCLDLVGGKDGTHVQLWDCNGHNNQQWFGGGVYQWLSKQYTTKCLDLSGGDTTNGKLLELWDCAPAGPPAPGPAPTGFDSSLAKTFATYSYAAYCTEDAINAWNCKYCQAVDNKFHATAILNQGTETQGFVGTSNGNIVVAFRGTTDLTNWITNLKFAKSSPYPKCNGCAVHDGFYDAWNSVKDNFVSAVKKLLSQMPQAQLFVTGHSLGAALAVLCAAELHYSQVSHEG
jgi:hypothetical protein